MPADYPLRWDPGNIAHIARHGVRPVDVEEARDHDPLIQHGYAGRVVLIGPTASGKMITAVLEPTGEVYYPVTARSASRKERALYRAARGGVGDGE